MKKCEACGKEIPEEVPECSFCKETQEKAIPVVSLQASSLKRFKGFATLDGKKYAGVFEAVDEQDARQRLMDQGFEFITVEPDRPTIPRKRNILSIFFDKILQLCSAYPILLAIPPLLILLVLSYNENAKNSIHAPVARAVHFSAPQPGDLVALKGGFFLAEDKKIFATAVLHQRSGNTAAFKRIFSEHPMLITKEGMSVFFEGRDGIVPGAIKVRFQDGKDVMYTDYEAIKLAAVVVEPVKVPGGPSGNVKGLKVDSEKRQKKKVLEPK